MNYKTIIFVLCIYFVYEANSLKILHNLDKHGIVKRDGVVFSKLTTEKYFESSYKDLKSLKVIDILNLEKIFSYFSKRRNNISDLNANLNNIYQLCDVNRENYINEFSFNSLSFEKADLIAATVNSSTILTELMDFKRGNFSPEIESHLRNNLHVKGLEFDIYKHKLKFKTTMNIAGSLRVAVDVSYDVPTLKIVDLYKITYIPEKYYYRNTIETLTKQKYKYLIDEDRYGNRCDFKPLGYDEFTSIGGGKFFFLFKDESNYKYKCNVNEETGTIQTGILQMEKNCVLTTAHSIVNGTNGLYQVIKTDNDELISQDFWNNFPWEMVGIIGGSILGAIV
uniref:Uncharacterized protein n=1 Tax=Megaselia scalaris TaxID=36166 RepID=T1GPM9_MEGSC